MHPVMKTVGAVIVFFMASCVVQAQMENAEMSTTSSVAQDAVPLLKQMLTLAKQNGGQGQEAQIDAVKQRIAALPKPARGDRKAARLHNDKGLEAVKKEQFDQALQHFLTAYQLDASDVEVVNNIGFAALKTGNLPDAARYLGIALSMAPSRAGAWSDLANVYARSGRIEDAVAAYSLTFRFSKSQDNTRRFLEQQAAGADHPHVMQAAQQVLALPLIHGGTESEKPPNQTAVAMDKGDAFTSESGDPPKRTAGTTSKGDPFKSETVMPSKTESDVPTLQHTHSEKTDNLNRIIKTVVAEGVGSDVQSAAQNAAQNALTNVVGSFMDANKMMEKRTAIRDGIRSQTTNIRTDIKEYSQGSIQRFEILEAKNEGGLTRVTAKVAVRIEDFRVYMKKLAEGEATVGGGLFAQMTTEKKQSDNLVSLVKDNIMMPILKGEVVRLNVSEPKPYNALPDAFRNQLEHNSRNYLEHHGRTNVLHFTVIATFDSGFYDNMTKTINAVAAERKNTTYNGSDYYAGLGVPSSETDWWLFLLQKEQKGSSPVVAFRLKDVKSDLLRSIPWLNSQRTLSDVPSLEISLLNSEGNAVQSELTTADDSYGLYQGLYAGGRFVTRNTLIIPVFGIGSHPYEAFKNYVPWIPIALSEYYPMILREKSFHVLMAVEPSALRSAHTINVKLVN